MDDVWLRCSACKQELRFEQMHWVCSVSTCSRRATRQVFCSVNCWDSHVATLRHRDSWAVEARAPSRQEWAREQASAMRDQPPARPAQAVPSAPGGPVARRVVGAAAPAPTMPAGGPTLSNEIERDILIVMSKLKKYIKDRSGMNTSDGVVDGLSDHVRAIADDAIRAAAADGRKTVLDRDIPRPRR